MLKHRLFFGALLIAGLVGLIYADVHFADRWATGDMPGAFLDIGLHTGTGVIATLVLVILIVMGTRELQHLLSAAGHAPLTAWPIAVNVGLLLIVFHAGNGPVDDDAARAAADHRHTLIWLTVALLGTAVAVAARRRVETAIDDMATTLFIIFYLGILPQYLLRLRMDGPDAAWLLLYVVGTVKVCDIGAYFTGRALGRHKLIPWLSPGKTVEGLAGGVIFSMLFAVSGVWFVGEVAPAASPLIDRFPGPAMACVFGLLMALAGQAGDLLESLIKRNARAKDSAGAIPAFGGVLDILDSLLVAAPIACWILLE